MSMIWQSSQERPISALLLSIHSSDWEEHWETRTSHLKNNELPSKRIKVETLEDYNIISGLNVVNVVILCVLFMFN